jgi:ParB-like chromosome segregation protein Spo0J
MVEIRNRVKELRMVRASELQANPANWRKHPQAQRDALAGVLEDVGYADALIAREMPDGTLQLIDGHLRADLTPDEEVPVLVTDLNDAEAALVLATLDPLAAMAETDQAALASLLATFDTDNEAVLEMLAELSSEELDLKPTEIVEDDVPEPPADPITKPGDLWLLGVYWECDSCGKRVEYDDGITMNGRCSCG